MWAAQREGGRSPESRANSVLSVKVMDVTGSSQDWTDLPGFYFMNYYTCPWGL